MKISLKGLKIYAAMSEETTAFTADVVVNGKVVAYAKNSGHGGETYYHPYTNADRTLLGAAEGYCKGLPKDEFGYDQSLTDIIDDLVYEKEKADAEKKLIKNMNKGICYGNKRFYHTISWTNNNIPKLLESKLGIDLITKKLQELKNKGETVLNTNIPQSILDQIK